MNNSGIWCFFFSRLWRGEWFQVLDVLPCVSARIHIVSRKKLDLPIVSQNQKFEGNCCSIGCKPSKRNYAADITCTKNLIADLFPLVNVQLRLIIDSKLEVAIS